MRQLRAGGGGMGRVPPGVARQTRQVGGCREADMMRGWGLFEGFLDDKKWQRRGRKILNEF